MNNCFECLDCGELWKTQFASGQVCPNCGLSDIVDPHLNQPNLFEQYNERVVKALNDNWGQVIYALRLVTRRHDIDADVQKDAQTAIDEIKAALESR